MPARIDAIVTLLRMHGTKSFEEAAQPTRKILDSGGPTRFIDSGSREKIETGVHWQAGLAATYRTLVDAERRASGSADNFVLEEALRRGWTRSATPRQPAGAWHMPESRVRPSTSPPTAQPMGVAGRWRRHWS